ncbi:hypothetical protein GE09DRAFT_1225312 [Coniochaeta sp. 2T2.1]|nr:hypothetical protein GE09DRAFT_1225312 [Coniochaeta sp. 2T2.1]
MARDLARDDLSYFDPELNVFYNRYTLSESPFRTPKAFKHTNIKFLLHTLAFVAAIIPSSVLAAPPTPHDSSLPPTARLTSFNPAFLKPDSEVAVLTTLDSALALNAQYDRRVRNEVVGDRHVVIYESDDNSTHVGTLAGEALEMALWGLNGTTNTAVAGAAGEEEKTCDAACVGCKRNWCFTIFACGKGCIFCYWICLPP